MMANPWYLPPISPAVNSTLVAVGTSASVSIMSSTSTPSDANTVQVINVGTAEAFLAFGKSDVSVVAGGTITAADTGGTSIPAGAVLSYSAYLPSVTHMAAITNSGTTTLRITRGNGS